jgi:hypothetical protein
MFIDSFNKKHAGRLQMNRQEISSSVTRLKEMAKVITLSLPRITDISEISTLHSQSLDLLMGLGELESKLSQGYPQNMTYPPKSTSISSFDEDLEVKKLKSRLPRWAIKPNQINSKILSLFLAVSKNGAPVTVNALKSAYGKDSEFEKNFPQMKTISERNHGKVFEVTDGIVSIWPKAASLVEEYSKQVGI